MQDEYKITLLERFFDRHMMAVSDRIGLENARSYARNVQGRIESAASIAGVSLLIVVILIIGMTGLDEETLGMFNRIQKAAAFQKVLEFLPIGSIPTGFDNVRVARHNLLERGIKQPHPLGLQQERLSLFRIHQNGRNAFLIPECILPGGTPEIAQHQITGAVVATELARITDLTR